MRKDVWPLSLQARDLTCRALSQLAVDMQSLVTTLFTAWPQEHPAYSACKRPAYSIPDDCWYWLMSTDISWATVFSPSLLQMRSFRLMLCRRPLQGSSSSCVKRGREFSISTRSRKQASLARHTKADASLVLQAPYTLDQASDATDPCFAHFADCLIQLPLPWCTLGAC